MSVARGRRPLPHILGTRRAKSCVLCPSLHFYATNAAARWEEKRRQSAYNRFDSHSLGLLLSFVGPATIRRLMNGTMLQGFSWYLPADGSR